MIVDIEKMGKKYKAIAPDDSTEGTWQYGIIIGPPDLSGHGLPPSIEVRLHNELFVRGVITNRDLRTHPNDLHGALIASLKVDVQRIAQIYEEMSE